MYCPQCGQERISEATNFCSRCGFLLTVTSELLPTGGVLPVNLSPAVPGTSPRTRGIKQGIFLIILAAVTFPVLGLLSAFLLRIEPWPAGVVLFLLAGAGLLRIAYALMFESKTPLLPGTSTFAGPPVLGGSSSTAPLLPEEGWPKAGVVGAADPNAQFPGPQSQFIPASGHWRDTNDLEPPTVTENTTKLLEKDPD